MSFAIDIQSCSYRFSRTKFEQEHYHRYDKQCVFYQLQAKLAHKNYMYVFLNVFFSIHRSVIILSVALNFLCGYNQDTIKILSLFTTCRYGNCNNDFIIQCINLIFYIQVNYIIIYKVNSQIFYLSFCSFTILIQSFRTFLKILRELFSQSNWLSKNS